VREGVADLQQAMTRLGIEPRTYGLKVKKSRRHSAECGGKTKSSPQARRNEEA